MTGLYGTLERMRSVELQIASVALLEVERARVSEAQVTQNLGHCARAALSAGGRVEWKSAETGLQVSEARADRLRQMSLERAAEYATAREAHRISQVEMKQIERLMESARMQEVLVEERRAQGSSDDRYASRREWTRRKAMREHTADQGLRKPVHEAVLTKST